MRKLILCMMTSLDGLTARENRDLEWFLADPEFEADMIALLGSVDGMLFGRVAYEELKQFWPTAGTTDAKSAPGGFTSDANRIEFARLMNSVPKLVISRTLDRLEWGPGRVLGGDLAQEIAALKRENGRDLVFFAGAKSAAELLALGVFDEYRLLVHPIVLGKGLPLFANAPERPLTLRDTRTYPCGVVKLHYTLSQ
ncbi:MAG TPA: dihydrofolate reductase family protein [Polyangiales bacterium]|nr:dihydrofolate reductase family protein [Polyangiales bacterium]